VQVATLTIIKIVTILLR